MMVTAACEVNSPADEGRLSEVTIFGSGWPNLVTMTQISMLLNSARLQ